MLDTVDIDSKSHILLINDEDTKKILEEDYTLSGWQQFKLVFVREWKLLKRNKQFIASHVFSDLFMGLIIGSLFFGLRRTSFQIRYGLFFLGMWRPVSCVSEGLTWKGLPLFSCHSHAPPCFHWVRGSPVGCACE
jgi:hypothetical protein